MPIKDMLIYSAATVLCGIIPYILICLIINRRRRRPSRAQEVAPIPVYQTPKQIMTASGIAEQQNNGHRLRKIKVILRDENMVDPEILSNAVWILLNHDPKWVSIDSRLSRKMLEMGVKMQARPIDRS